jgi:tRNA G10  N-methylase Trm11
MLSSPPYFISEKYSNDPDQSYFHHDLLNWLERFMYPSINLIYSVMKKGGYVLMVINDVYLFRNNKHEKVEYVDKIIKYFSQNKFILIDIMKISIMTSIQPLLVFKKLY